MNLDDLESTKDFAMVIPKFPNYFSKISSIFLSFLNLDPPFQYLPRTSNFISCHQLDLKSQRSPPPCEISHRSPLCL